ncbi:hypothetical protein [Pedobacter metabolipauper]|uniref:30S ribosomal protein S10 n=1 Tax=Pedobacter metabolipauper TaxID=425513 RepID=A0A4R6SRI0_9SPHI|nr:hypothetical protein [Pedobacter metabolipauper]TDQ07610.1 hypothetical protein ATK78_3737 [Pedobacter metabolipauper]
MKKILSLAAILLITLTVHAQLATDTTNKKPADTIKAVTNLQAQYELMLSRSKTVNGYKLLNPYRLSTFWKNVVDTLTTERNKQISSEQKALELEQEISGLKSQVSGSKTVIASSNSKSNEVSFLGMSVTKTNYSITVWSIIIALAIALTVVILRSAKHIHEAKYRRTLYDEIAQEYQNYKTKANDKEKKLARELQDERNKLDDLKSQGKN